MAYNVVYQTFNTFTFLQTYGWHLLSAAYRKWLVFGFVSFNLTSFDSAQLIEFDLKDHTEGSLVCILQGPSFLKVL